MAATRTKKGAPPDDRTARERCIEISLEGQAEITAGLGVEVDAAQAGVGLTNIAPQPVFLVEESGKGECTIDGCNTTTCPREGTCVQVYSSEFLSVACEPELEDRPQLFTDELEQRITACNASPAAPASGEPVACNDCDVHEVCLPEGLCADLLSVRTSCRKRCRSDTVCRDGYECRETGTNGVYRVATPDHPFGDGTVKICMPVRDAPDEE